jgi:fermentation-respiration switch protein FrsA (DUF1100 family)
MQSKFFSTRWTIGCLLPIVLLYVCLAPQIAWPLYNSILFQPTHTLDSENDWEKIERDFNVKRAKITFPTEDGKMIEAWFIRLPNCKRVFLVSQGKGGSLYRRAGMARMLLHCGGSVLIYNYRGYGKSEGSPSLDGVCLDAVGAYDYLVKQQDYSGKSIIAYGESFGSGVTGQLVAKRQVGGVILQSGFSSLLRASKDVLPWLRLYPRNCFPKQMMDNIAVFSKQHPPLLIVHGQKDTLVLCKNAEDLFGAASAPKSILILQDGDHGSFGKGNEYFVAVETFLNSNKL